MLLLRKEKDGVWVKHKYRGADIELKIRPADPDLAGKLNKTHTRTEYTKDHAKVRTLDSEAYIEDMADYIIEDFRGFGYSEKEPLAVNKDNKVLIAFLAPLNGEQSLWDFIVETANKLRTITEEEAKELEKN